MTSTLSLWQSTEPVRRFYLIPDGLALAPGTAVLHGPGGQVAALDEESLMPFAVSEAQAHRWAEQELGDTLSALKQGLHERAEELKQQRSTPAGGSPDVTADAAPALLDLLRKLPAMIAGSLTADRAGVESLTASMQTLQQRLKDAGIDLDGKLAAFPERLAGLHDEFTRRRGDDDEPPQAS